MIGTTTLTRKKEHTFSIVHSFIYMHIQISLISHLLWWRNYLQIKSIEELHQFISKTHKFTARITFSKTGFSNTERNNLFCNTHSEQDLHYYILLHIRVTNKAQEHDRNWEKLHYTKKLNFMNLCGLNTKCKNLYNKLDDWNYLATIIHSLRY